MREGIAALKGRTKVSSILDQNSGDIFPMKGGSIPFMNDGKRSTRSLRSAGLGNSQQKIDSSQTHLEAHGEVDINSDDSEDVLVESVVGSNEVNAKEFSALSLIFSVRFITP
jgi:hypothetical protein